MPAPSPAVFYFLTTTTSGTVYRGPLRADGLDKVLTVPRGLDQDWLCLIRPVGPLKLIGSADVVLTFTGNETLSGTLWEGQDGPIAATLTGAWIEPLTGWARFSLDRTSTDTLAAAVYSLRLTLTADDGGTSRIYPLHEALVRILPRSGSHAASGPLYCAADDVRAEIPWADDERPVGSGVDRMGYLGERDRASRWIDRTVLARVKKARIASGLAIPLDPVLIPPTDLTSDIAAALADGRLRTGDAALVRATALYAASLVRTNTPDRDMRQQLRNDAIRELLGWSALLDLDDDGDYETLATP